MDRAKEITHKGKKIFFMDFSNITTIEEITKIIEYSANYIRTKPVASLYTLTTIENMRFNNDIKDKFTEFVKGNKPYVKAGSVVGISGLQTFVYNAIMKITGRNLKAMGSLDQAKDWLASQN